MTIELNEDTQAKVDDAKSKVDDKGHVKVDTNTKTTNTKAKTKNTKATKGQNAKANNTTFNFMACSSGKIPGCNIIINDHVEAFTPGKRYDIDIATMTKLPNDITKSLAPMFKQFGKKYPLCIGHNYGGLQVGLNQNESTTWGNVLSFQDSTVFFTSSRVIPLGGIDTIKAKMSKHATPANRSSGTWAGWSVNKGIPATKDMQAAIKAILS